MVEQLQGTERSCNNKLNIVNHCCMGTIIGQIEPWGSLKTRTAQLIKRKERVLSIKRGSTELSNVGVCREMSCNIAKGSVNRSSSASHSSHGEYSSHDAWKQHRNNSKNSLEN